MKLVKIIILSPFSPFLAILTNFTKLYLLMYEELEEIPFEFLVEDSKFYNFVIGTLNSLGSFGGL